MNTETRFSDRSINAQTRVRTAAFAVLCSLVSAAALADQAAGPSDHEVTVAIQVSTRGLDLNQPAGAQKLYWRLKHVAREACTTGHRVGLAPSPDPTGCLEKALADAIRSANSTLLTQVYLASHTPQEAAAHGIDVPVQMAAK